MSDKTFNHGYFARGYFFYKGQLEQIDATPVFPSSMSLLDIADAARDWAMSTPEVEAYQLYRRLPGEHLARVVGCKIMLEKEEQCHG